MMQAFMKATGGVEDETNKRERTKTIIKTIKVLLNYFKNANENHFFGLHVNNGQTYLIKLYRKDNYFFSFVYSRFQ